MNNIDELAQNISSIIIGQRKKLLYDGSIHVGIVSGTMITIDSVSYNYKIGLDLIVNDGDQVCCQLMDDGYSALIVGKC